MIVLPLYKTGDLVTASVPFESGIDGLTYSGLIISVQQSNSVPDAKVRGLENLQPWSYWVFTSECKVLGPLSQDRINRV